MNNHQSSKEPLNSEKNTVAALEAIAKNTACTREAVGVAARLGETWILYVGVITISIAVLLLNSHDSFAPPLCYGAIAIFGLYSIIHSLTLLSDLKHTVEEVSDRKPSEKGGITEFFKRF